MTADVFHPKAARRFEERGIELRKGIESLPLDITIPSRSFDSDVYTSGVIGPSDILGPIINILTDKNGSEVGRVLLRDERPISLHGDAHKEFLALVDSVQRTASFRESVASSTVRDWIWNWLISEQEKKLVDVLIESFRSEVVPQKIVIPIYELLLPKTIKLPSVTLLTISRTLLDELDSSELTNFPESSKIISLKARQEQRRQRLQGKSAALVELTAERQYAREYALDQTEIVLGILRMASPGVGVARSRSYCTVLGAESVQTRQIFRFDGETLRPDQSWIESPPPQHWSIDSDRLDNAILPLLTPWYALVALGRKRTEFQESVLKATLLFSRSTLQERLGEKLLHALTGLESVLLRDTSEPIGMCLADRMAFLAEPKAEKRQSKAQLVRIIYGYRSRFVHHAEEIDARPQELAQVEEFMIHAILSLRALAVKSLRGGTRHACLAELDARKYT